MSVAACPECEGQVTLPPGARAISRVKCPLCDAEYPLSDLYAKLPPMLVLLDAPVEVPVHAAAGSISHGSSAFDSVFTPSGAANGEGEFNLAGGDDEVGSFAFGEESGGGTAVGTAPSKTVTLRPKKPPKSAVKEIIKIVLGGVVGLLIGFMILLWGFNRDLSASVAGKPIGKLLPAWMHWAIPAAHRPGGAAKPAPDADNTPAADDEQPAEDGTTDDGSEMPGAEGTQETNTATDPPADSGTPEKPGEGNAATTDSGSDSTETPMPPANSNPGDTTPEKTPDDKTPDDKTPKSPATDDPGFTIDPKPPEFQIEDPKIDPITPEKKPTDDPTVTDPPADMPPVEDPFDIKPGETPTEDPATNEPKPKPPAVGLKVESPLDEKAVESARSAASDVLETLMPSDAAAKAGFTREKYDAFTKLCEYSNSLSNSAPEVAATNAEAAKAMMLMVVGDEADNKVLGQLANAWLSKKRPNNGIALAGKVTAVATADGLTTVTIELPALGDKLAVRSATIVTKETAEVATGDEVAAVGTVVDKPTDKIDGYKGADAEVIWGAWIGKRGQ